MNAVYTVERSNNHLLCQWFSDGIRMKQCVECNHVTEDFRTQCPECGAGSFVQGVEADGVDRVLSGYQKQAKSAEIVDEAVGYFQQGKHERAIAVLKEAIRMNPNNATAHGNIGFILSSIGKSAEAIPYLERALELNPHLEGIPEVLIRARRQVE
jgi:tetratricopeptide (TPR) repeat protein